MKVYGFLYIISGSVIFWALMRFAPGATISTLSIMTGSCLLPIEMGLKWVRHGHLHGRGMGGT